MTAQYSNAVLMAVLPLVTDFLAKLDLPVHRPVTVRDVSWCRLSPYTGDIEAAVILEKSRYWFYIDGRQGGVANFRAPTMLCRNLSRTTGNA